MDALASPRPLSFGVIVAVTLRIYRSHYLTFVAILGLYEVANYAIPLASRALSVLSDPPGSFLFVLPANLLRGLSFAACTYAAGQAYAGRRASISAAYRKALSCLGLIVGVTIAFGVCLLLLAILLVYSNRISFELYSFLTAIGVFPDDIAFRISVASVFDLGVFAILAVLPFLVALAPAARWSMAPCAMVLESLGARAALSRSGRLVKGNWWRVFGILLALALIYFVVSLAFPLIAILISVARIPGISALGSASSEVTAAMPHILFGAFPCIGITVLYYDLRARKEGLAVPLS